MTKVQCFLCLSLASGLLLAQIPTARSAEFDSLVSLCKSCHGQDGNSPLPLFPSIAGYSYESFLGKINAYRDNERIAEEFQDPNEPETVMTNIARRLSEQDVDALARYFSTRTFIPVSQPIDIELAKRGAILHQEKCERCHTNNGSEPLEDAAILAGQWTPYLRLQFEYIASGKRIALASMRQRLKKLSQDEIEALLNFYASAGMESEQD